MLYWDQVRKHMHEITGLEIEKRAIMEVITYLESEFDVLIKQSVIEKDKLNELKQIQGIHQKVRIDGDCIKNAIKTINSNGHSPLSEKTGGITQKKENKFEKHSPEMILTEVS